ncbi:glycosyltransferase family 2 protein [Lederbergia wuyishanensis]|uniref:Glycosyltransferase involved in cell wall biosynthesis n=1 Tax=Lederbergia wuyishanensis TaxID=1347903 RepID=A0ABU0D9H5_9BACI|nr:glycosyltransferase family 2 protein [Lederbergia wuyishanensis]MDQ0345035.1 glycosyltransferase involved in cell wall biosynthesis [Lederbergia wuyishanensis]
MVTVITPVYNGETFLKKSIESVMNQTLGFQNIEYILIDDCSTDRSKEILNDFGKIHDNVIVVSLDCNSGTPARPRNIGVELATSPYITFLDADDWLDPNGLQILYEILEETGDPYVVGKTIRVDNVGTQVVGEHQSCKERRRVSPISIPHIFHHLGPTARMIRTSFIKEQQIQFPEMKFAEDKQFFIDVLTSCKTISTTTKPIYYVNRLNDTKKTRLTNQTNILQKSNYNLQVVRYILNRKLDIEIEKMIVNRIYEYDLTRRLFTTPHFQNTKLKLLYFYKYKQILKTANKLAYDFTENFLQPIHKVIYELIRERRYKEVTQLLEWEKTMKVKEVVIKNDKPYLVIPFLEEKYKYIPMPIFFIFKQHYCQGNQYILHFLAYGDDAHSITEVLIRDLKNAHYDYVLPITIKENGEGFIEFKLDSLKDLPPSNYSIYVRYNEYMKMNIRQLIKNEIKHHYENREFIFYHSVYSNVALKIK